MIDPRNLIGRKLKDDAIIEIISSHDLKVWYDIDTLHENIPDAYWIQDFSHGFTLKFDEHQVFVACFVYLRPREGHATFPWEIPGITVKDGKLVGLGEPTKTGSVDGESWMRYDGPKASVHLSCDALGPRMITFMNATQAP